jgi:predicted RNA-binding protein YlxR (DUF448 family)
MVRMAASTEGVKLDKESRLGGRGGYLHRRPECLERFVKSKVKIFRSLGREVGRQARIDLAAAVVRLAIDSTGD